MKIPFIGPVVGLVLIVCLSAKSGGAQDWPQWRGPNRDAKATGFDVPATWPEELTQKWQVTVGVGVSTPALVGDRLYVFSREGDNEVIRCLDAGSGSEIWRDEYETEDTEGGASRYPGPRSSPTVADGKVLTLGVRSILSCLDATTGEVLWRKDDLGAWPMFFTASSPIVVEGLCITQLGGEDEGAVVAYDLESGEEKWKWDGDAPAYGSPVLMNVDGTNVIVTPTGRYLVALDPADGRLLMQLQYSEGRYNAGTPIVDGQTIVVAGLGTGLTAVKLSKEGDKIVSEEIWSNTDNPLRFNTPVLKDNLLIGLSARDQLFCIDIREGETEWTTAIAPPEAEAAQRPQREEGPRQRGDRGRGPGGRGRGGRGGRGGGGGGGFGSVVDAGSVLIALSPSGQLIVFEPTGEEFKQIASYKVAEGGANAYPVLSGNRIYIKDQNSVTLWTVE